MVTEGNKVFGNGGRLYSDAPPSSGSTSVVGPSSPAKSVEKKPRRVIVWRDWGSTAAELLGVAAVSYGCYQIYAPAGWLAGGVSLVVLGVAAGADS